MTRALASPKSPILTYPLLFNKIFAILRSLWTMLFSCRYLVPSMIYWIIHLISGISNLYLFFIKPMKSCSMYSNTNNVLPLNLFFSWPLVTIISFNFNMFGWLSYFNSFISLKAVMGNPSWIIFGSVLYNFLRAKNSLFLRLWALYTTP